MYLDADSDRKHTPKVIYLFALQHFAKFRKEILYCMKSGLVSI